MDRSCTLLRSLVLSGVIGLLWPCSLQVGWGADVSLNAVADAFVTSAQPDSNYGAAGGLSVAASGLPKGEFQSVLRFDASAAKASFDATFGAGQWLVQNVTLCLTAAYPNNTIFNASAAGRFAIEWMQNDSWVEGTGTPSTPGTTGITFNTLPSFLSGSDQSLGQFDFDGATTGSITYTLEPASNLLADLSAGNLVSMRMLAASATVSGVFNSRNFGTPAYRPLLSLTAVPEPVTLSLLAVGLVYLRRCRGSIR